MDAVYTLNYTANKEMAKRRGKLFVFFADVKTAFDKENRQRESRQTLTRRDARKSQGWESYF